MIDRTLFNDLNINDGMLRRVNQSVLRGKERTVKTADGVIPRRKQFDAVLQSAEMAQPPL